MAQQCPCIRQAPALSSGSAAAAVCVSARLCILYMYDELLLGVKRQELARQATMSRGAKFICYTLNCAISTLNNSHTLD